MQVNRVYASNTVKIDKTKLNGLVMEVRKVDSFRWWFGWNFIAHLDGMTIDIRPYCSAISTKIAWNSMITVVYSLLFILFCVSGVKRQNVNKTARNWRIIKTFAKYLITPDRLLIWITFPDLNNTRSWARSERGAAFPFTGRTSREEIKWKWEYSKNMDWISKPAW